MLVSFLLCFLVVGVSNARQVCYGKYGCFSRQPPFNNLLVSLPLGPSLVGTTFNLYTRSNRKDAYIIDDSDEQKLENSHFDMSTRTILVIHGYTESKDKWPTPMKDALLEREDCNVILVDWSRGAFIPYSQAAGNTRLVGAQTTELIRFLISSNSGSPALADRFYIVGFSLGAQIAGYAGTNLLAHGMVLGRITGLDLVGPYFSYTDPSVRLDPGDAKFVDVIRTDAGLLGTSQNVGHIDWRLDPAGPYFSYTDPSVRLDPGDAKFVDVIHTDAGLLGTSQNVGHIDFFPNGGSRQPGCYFSLINIIKSVSCDHYRATKFYIATVQNHLRCPWTAYPCKSVWHFKKGKCRKCDGECPSMGYSAAPIKQTGSFYINTNSKAPFCG